MNALIWVLGGIGVALCFLGFPVPGLIITSSILLAGFIVAGKTPLRRPRPWTTEEWEQYYRDNPYPEDQK